MKKKIRIEGSVYRRKNTEAPALAADPEALEKLTEERTAAFVKLFDEMEEAKLSEDDARIIARHATKDEHVSDERNFGLEDLSDLQVHTLTGEEFNRTLARARQALSRIIEMRETYSAGPFYRNRGMRKRGKGKGVGPRRSASASAMIAAQKARREARSA
jgi:hypothetical protein